MNTRRYQREINRDQTSMLPPRTEDYVDTDSWLHGLDSWVESLDMHALGFEHSQASSGAGKPPYNPKTLLKLYIFGYKRGVRSSRWLEDLALYHTQVMWLCRNARPCYKTIANFRKNNGQALKATHREFVCLCRGLDLLGRERVAIDGTIVKANVKRNSIHTVAHVKRVLKEIEAKLKTYYQQMDEQDAEEDQYADEELENVKSKVDAHLKSKEGHPELAAQSTRSDEKQINKEDEQEGTTDAGADENQAEVKIKIEALHKRKQRYQELQEQLKRSGENQISEVDEDARLMSRRGQTIGAYNAQVAVDDRHHIIVAEDVSQNANDINHLAPMMEAAAESLESDNLNGIADSGYCNAKQLSICENKGMEVIVADRKHVKRRGSKGRFGSDDFDYDPSRDEYVCPAGERLIRSGNTIRIRGTPYVRYRARIEKCKDCSCKAKCLPKTYKCRILSRSLYADASERNRQLLRTNPKVMQERASIVEHTFGTLKYGLGFDRFSMRGLQKCRGEWSLMTLSYNFKRVFNLIGVEQFIEHCTATQMIG